jgi:hypothetical protein
MVEAGEKQKQTAAKLKSAGGKLRSGAVYLNSDGQIVAAIKGLKTGATAIRVVLGPVVSALNFVEQTLNGITVPTISTSTTKIMNVNVITGIQIGSTKPLQTVGAKVGQIGEKVDGVRTQLDSMADQLGQLESNMPKIKNEIVQAADDIEASCNSMTEMGDKMIDAGKKMS